MSDPVHVTHTVLLELAWVLAGNKYRYDRPTLAATLQALIKTSTVHTADDQTVRWAIERFAAGGDIADMLHIASLRGYDTFISFERRLAERAGPAAPVAIARPG